MRSGSSYRLTISSGIWNIRKESAILPLRYPPQPELSQFSQWGCVCNGFKLTPEPPRKPGSPQNLPCPPCYFPLSYFQLGTLDQWCPGHLIPGTDMKRSKENFARSPDFWSFLLCRFEQGLHCVWTQVLTHLSGLTLGWASNHHLQDISLYIVFEQCRWMRAKAWV